MPLFATRHDPVAFMRPSDKGSRLVRMNARRTPPSGSPRRPPGRSASRDGKRRSSRPENAPSNSSPDVAGREGLRRSSARSKPDTPPKPPLGERTERKSSRDRFSTRRQLVVDGGRGTRKFSLRIVAVVLTAFVAMIIVFPTVRTYYVQQRELATARAELADFQERNAELENELRLWNDEEFVRAQARERLGYVMPGETLYVVNDPSKGSAQEQLEERIRNVNRERRAATPWFMTMWDSIEISGQSVTEFDNPNNAPVITPNDGGAYSPPSDDDPILGITPTQEETNVTPSNSGPTDADDTLQDESSQDGAP